ncbi:MAG: polymer-forming cytoskeletal protein [Sphingomonadales bacterium]|nr:polymer-forming cytoskeletal protein [Sphingomonadales bacterium]
MTQVAPSIIGTDVRITGSIDTNGEIQLDGVVEGDVNCKTLTLGERGVVTGNVVSESIVVRGKVVGDIRARTVRLEKSANVSGDVWHESISIEAGAYFVGRVSHTDKSVNFDAKAPEKEKVAS